MDPTHSLESQRQVSTSLKHIKAGSHSPAERQRSEGCQETGNVARHAATHQLKIQQQPSLASLKGRGHNNNTLPGKSRTDVVSKLKYDKV